MSPNTDLQPAIANTLAVIQGKESLSSLIDELDYAQYEQVYLTADELNRMNVIAIRQNDGYTVKNHGEMWVRRIR